MSTSTMASANDFEELQAVLRAKNSIIDVQKQTIEQLRQQLGELLGEQLGGPSNPPSPKTPAEAATKAPEVVDTPVHEVPKEAKAADYVLAASPKAVALRTFETYAKGPVTRNGFFYHALSYLRTVCKNGVGEHRRAIDSLIAYHGKDSNLELASTEVEPNKLIVSFDTWETVFAGAGFVPGPSVDYVPVHELAKLPAQTSKSKSSATPSKTTTTETSVVQSYKVVPRTA